MSSLLWNPSVAGRSSTSSGKMSNLAAVSLWAGFGLVQLALMVALGIDPLPVFGIAP